MARLQSAVVVDPLTYTEEEVLESIREIAFKIGKAFGFSVVCGVLIWFISSVLFMGWFRGRWAGLLMDEIDTFLIQTFGGMILVFVAGTALAYALYFRQWQRRKLAELERLVRDSRSASTMAKLRRFQEVQEYLNGVGLIRPDTYLDRRAQQVLFPAFPEG